MEGSSVEGYMLSLTKKSHHLSPAQTLYFLTYYTATKNSFTLLEIIIGQEKMHGRCVQESRNACYISTKLQQRTYGLDILSPESPCGHEDHLSLLLFVPYKGVLFLDPEVPFVARSVGRSIPSFSECNLQILCWHLQIILFQSCIIKIFTDKIEDLWRSGERGKTKSSLRSPKVLPSAWSCSHGWLGEHVTGLFLFRGRLRNHKESHHMNIGGLGKE